MWSLEEYCANQQHVNWNDIGIPESTRRFVQSLNLPSIHPFCQEKTPFAAMEGIVPPMGPLEHRFEDQTYLQALYTMWCMVAPPLLAMGELWLRLFAGAIGPLGITYLIVQQGRNVAFPQGEKNKNFARRRLTLIAVVTVASNLVLMTDTLYVLDYGPVYGTILFLISVLAAFKVCVQFNLRMAAIIVYLLVLLTTHLLWDSSSHSFSFGNKIDAVRTVEEGLYYDTSNSYIQSIVLHWPQKYRTYTHADGATRWMPTGDSRTGLPFLLFLRS